MEAPALHLDLWNKELLLPSRWDNKKTLTRLFQSYVNDFGSAAGGKIIHAIIFELGGLRLTIPEDYRSGNNELISSLRTHLCDTFGEASGNTIMKKFLMELKGLRISFPSFQTIYIQERNQRIKNLAGKMTITELVLRFAPLSKSQIWRIVNGE